MKQIRILFTTILTIIVYNLTNAQIISPSGIIVTPGNNLTLQNLASGTTQSLGIDGLGKVIAFPMGAGGSSYWTLTGSVLGNSAGTSLRGTNSLELYDVSDPARTFTLSSVGRQEIHTNNDFVTYAGRNLELLLGQNPATSPITTGYEFTIRDHTGTDLFYLVGNSGKVSIGSGFFANPALMPGSYKLYVEGGILTENLKVAVKGSSAWADYVFGDKYNLMPLHSVNEFIKINKHLPNVPSAEEMAKEGIDVAKITAKLMEKIEESMLYIIDLNEQLINERKVRKDLEVRLQKLEKN